MPRPRPPPAPARHGADQPHRRPDPYGAVASASPRFELAGGEDLPFVGGAVGLFG